MTWAFAMETCLVKDISRSSVALELSETKDENLSEPLRLLLLSSLLRTLRHREDIQVDSDQNLEVFPQLPSSPSLINKLAGLRSAYQQPKPMPRKVTTLEIVTLRTKFLLDPLLGYAKLCQSLSITGHIRADATVIMLCCILQGDLSVNVKIGSFSSR